MADATKKQNGHKVVGVVLRSNAKTIHFLRHAEGQNFARDNNKCTSTTPYCCVLDSEPCTADWHRWYCWYASLLLIALVFIGNFCCAL